MSAIPSAAIEMKNARTPGRSARAQSCEMELVSCTIFPETD
jgi:hypothetical protein